jgi:hypothetical protein
MIDNFKNEDEERAFWATHSPLDYFNAGNLKKYLNRFQPVFCFGTYSLETVSRIWVQFSLPKYLGY